jgi:simple sugar transport system permease protein
MGAFVGLINGLLIVKMRVPDLLATLGMMFLLIGLQRIPTQGNSISTGMTLPDGEVAEGTFSPPSCGSGGTGSISSWTGLLPVPVVCSC